MQTIRSFIAIELNSEARQVLADLQNRLKPLVPPHSVSWTSPANLHLTLHFLGELALDKIEPTRQALAESVIGVEPFTLKLIELGCFPNLHRPRIIWVGVGGDSETLVSLHQQLGQALHSLTGFSPESRPYAPHLTLGRVKKGIPSRRLSQLAHSLAGQVPTVNYLTTWPVSALSLMKSELTPVGLVYSQLAEQQLG